jgi:tRNA nucleotidyltransferase/poly(A) polymerase
MFKLRIHMMNPVLKTILPKLGGAYIVGGSIRDLLLGYPPSDYDLAVLGNPESFAAKIASKISGRTVKLGKPGEPLYRIVSSGITVDVSGAKGDSIEADLAQRDFTINAMAYDLSMDAVIDPWGGRRDLSKKTIRMTSDTVFQKDPIRLLRAYRLAAVLDFKIDSKTEAAVTKDAFRIRLTAEERIRDELIRLFGSSNASPRLNQMAANGLLFSIIPELSDLNGCIQNAHHPYDVMTHTLKAFHYLDQTLGSPAALFPEPIEKIDNMPKGMGAQLKFALLLHDIGKPSVRTEDAAEQVHFYRHEKKSTQAAETILKRLRFSNHDIRFITTVISLHLRPLLLYQAHVKNRLTRRAVTRFFLASKDRTPAVLIHAVADYHGKKAGVETSFEKFIKMLMNRYLSGFEPKQSLPPLITGHDLIREFDLAPSPQFKDLLSQVEEARLSERISTRHDAEELVRQILSENQKTQR